MKSERRSLEIRIDRLFDTARGVENDELRAELTKYLCVLASGFLEVSCRHILSGYSQKRSSPEIDRFVRSRLSYFRSPTSGNIKQLLSAFDPGCAERWREGLDDEQADALDSIVSNRHLIAHGRSVGLSLHVLERYYLSANEAIAGLEEEFPPFK